ncbi:MAG: argininosuccinate synthase [Candidatus Nitrosocaldaceae archaeon]|nr:MAG: argininosuccinate synthase [Candidatus Nitrosocaldaceae archaeon]
MSKKAVLAYSGGLDTSVAIKMLQLNYGYDVITVTVDVGQNDDLKAIEDKAKEMGVIKHYTINAIDEFANEYITKCIKANGLYQGKYPLATALARPLIASKVVEIAKREDATALAHGCTGKGNDQIRFDITMRSLIDLPIIAPIREHNLTRDKEIEFVKENNIKISVEAKKYSIDQNLWGRAIEGGVIEDENMEVPDDAFSWVKIKDLPDEPFYMDIEFDNGIPISINDNSGSLAELIQYANEEAGRNGVGIIDHIEDRTIGLKSREVYETPAALCIIEAHKDLEKLNLTRNELRFKELVDDEWSWLTYSGLWLDPLMNALNSFIDKTQERINGKVKLKLYKGAMRVVGRESRYSLYNKRLATYGKDEFDQRLAKGFVELWGLQSILANEVLKR